MSSPITTPGNRLSVRIVSVWERSGPNGPFVSISVADEFDPGFNNINANEQKNERTRSDQRKAGVRHEECTSKARGMHE